MPQFLLSEPAEAIMATLGDALDLVDFAIILLNPDMRVRFVNNRLSDIVMMPADLLATGPRFREMLEYAASNAWYAVPAIDLPAYLDGREAEVRAGSIPATMIELADGRQLLFRCVACPDGGRILTYTDISHELQRNVSGVVERFTAELRFRTETLEDQGAHLATLAEAAEDHAQRAEAARILLETEIAERRELETRLRRLATTDSLTGALNRAELMASGDRQVAFARELGRAMAVLMLDVDHFKMINDRYGHAGGDRALQHLVSELHAATRQDDLLGRLGGEEFAVVLPGASPEAAVRLAERLRVRVANAPLAFGQRLITMTVSIGVAIRHETDRSIEQMIARADDALYRAKEGGRNQVIIDGQAKAA